MITQALTELGISVVCSKCDVEKDVTEMSKGHTYCKACRSAQQKAWRERNKEHVKKHKAEYNKKNEEHIKQWRKEYYAKNAEDIKASVREYYANNVEERREVSKQHKLANRHLYNAQQAKRRATKLNATPDWLTEDDLDVIGWVYEMAKDREQVTGVQHHVDHIVPLQGKDACGLHVWWNLQVIPASENLRKSNNLI